MKLRSTIKLLGLPPRKSRKTPCYSLLQIFKGFSHSAWKKRILRVKKKSVKNGSFCSILSGSLDGREFGEEWILISRVCVLSRFTWAWLFWDPRDNSPPGSSVHGILQARMLEWVAMSSSRGPSPPTDRTLVSYISSFGRQILNHECHLGSPDTCICVAKSLCCSPETIMTLLISYTLIQNKTCKTNKEKAWFFVEPSHHRRPRPFLWACLCSLLLSVHTS